MTHSIPVQAGAVRRRHTASISCTSSTTFTTASSSSSSSSSPSSSSSFQLFLLVSLLCLSADEAGRQVHQAQTLAFRNDSFVSWLRRGGVVAPKLAIVRDGATFEGRGVVAREDIARDEVVARIPYDMLVTAEMGTLSSRTLRQARVALAGRFGALEHILISMMLVENRAWLPYSRFWPYIQMLPQWFPHIPFFFRPDELAWLEVRGRDRDRDRDRDRVRDRERLSLCTWLLPFESVEGCISQLLVAS